MQHVDLLYSTTNEVVVFCEAQRLDLPSRWASRQVRLILEVDQVLLGAAWLHPPRKVFFFFVVVIIIVVE